MRKVLFLFLFMTVMASSMQAQEDSIRAKAMYCMSYADFQADRWIPLDTLYLKTVSKSHRFWLGGNDFNLTTGNEELDKRIKKEAFAVLYHDSLLVNCRNLRYQKTGFGPGYTLGLRYQGSRLCIINRLIGKKAAMNQAMAGFMFGAIGGGLAAAEALKDLRCYVLGEEDEKGRINIQLINDDFMEGLKANYSGLYGQYRFVSDEDKRQSAARVLPLLQEWELVK